MTFQENLRKCREAAGWKYARDFAEYIGIKYSTYVGYETQNREPKYETLVKIAKALDVSTDELLGYTGSVKDNFAIALRELRASGFHDDYNEEVKIAHALGCKPDAVNEFNVLFGADPESEYEYCFKCSPDLLIDAYNFVHSSENEQAFSNLRFGLYIKAFFQFELRKRRFLQERSAGTKKNSAESDFSSIEKRNRLIASSLEKPDNTSK